VDLTLPKFKATLQFELSRTLEDMGMKRAFSREEADFSGITKASKLCLSAVIHKAYIAVDEKGSEAAAATAVGIKAFARRAPQPPPIIFRADHPFIFLIRDNRSGSILFLGRMSDPSK
jgi:serpin B